jgi:RNA polymerase sigma-70 factor (ECF subfamily)
MAVMVGVWDDIQEAPVTDVATNDVGLADIERFRTELTGYCYRMLASVHDADDAVQETFVKAWQAIGGFEGRASLRSWVYRIATNVCLDMLRARQRRALPMDLSSPIPAPEDPGPPVSESLWLQPIADGDAVPADADPAQRVVLRDSIRLAFVAALQHLPPRQRAVLILREVLQWHADEVAQLLDTTVASVNSALQRARATMADRNLDALDASGRAESVDPELLNRYVAAFEAYDIEALVALLSKDGSISMPPWAMWMTGHENLKRWYVGAGKGCAGSRMQLLSVNGQPALAHWKPSDDGGLRQWAIQVLDVVDGEIVHIHHFIDFDGSLFTRFGLPTTFAA